MIRLPPLDWWEELDLEERERRSTLKPPVGTVSDTSMERRHRRRGAAAEKRSASPKGDGSTLLCLLSILAFLGGVLAAAQIT